MYRNNQKTYDALKKSLFVDEIGERYGEIQFRYSMKMAKHIVISSSPHGNPVILVLGVSSIFAKFRRGYPLWGRKIQVGSKNS